MALFSQSERVLWTIKPCYCSEADIYARISRELENLMHWDFQLKNLYIECHRRFGVKPIALFRFNCHVVMAMVCKLIQKIFIIIIIYNNHNLNAWMLKIITDQPIRKCVKLSKCAKPIICIVWSCQSAKREIVWQQN